jgi:hypothetical protein
MDKPTALELALVAAVIDPALAKAEPHRAVRVASELIRAAKYHIDWPFKGASQRLFREMMTKMDAKFDNIPEGDRISLAQAYDSFGKKLHYKTKNGFIAALKKEELTVWSREGDEITWKGAVTELSRLQAERRKCADRLRKKAGQMNSIKNRQRNFDSKKRKSVRKKRKLNR